MTDAKYRGRHRSRRGAGLSPRIVGTGLVLPTTATLAVVSVTGGAPMALTSNSTVATGSTTADDAAADRAELTRDKATDSALLARGVQDRVARDSERVRVDAVTAENARRAAAEASLAANEVPVQVSLAGAAGANPASVAALKGAGLGSKAWVNPINGGYHLTSPFGWRWGRLHSGQDMACPTGTPVRSISSGVVKFAGWAGALGYKVEVLHWDGTVSWYGHNSRLRVTEGQQVEAGQLIALSGSTGHSTGPHLHLEIHPNGGNAVPPSRWLAAHGVDL